MPLETGTSLVLAHNVEQAEEIVDLAAGEPSADVTARSGSCCDFQHALGEMAPDVPTTGPEPDWLLAGATMARTYMDLRAVVGDEKLRVIA